MTYDFTKIHGAHTCSEAMRIFDDLSAGDTLLFPAGYRIIFSGQTWSDFYRMAREIQSYISVHDFRD